MINSKAMSLASQKIRLVMEMRRAGIGCQAVLSAMERVAREEFVPIAFHDQAYENTALPLANGQTISQPLLVAQMIAALGLKPHHTVLEVGTGSGYQTAVLSQLARRVYSIDIFRDFTQSAAARLLQLGYRNTILATANGYQGWPNGAPYDRIILAACCPQIPPPLLTQLKPDGVLLAPVGEDASTQYLQRISRDCDNYTTEILAPVRFVPLLDKETFKNTQKAG